MKAKHYGTATVALAVAAVVAAAGTVYWRYDSGALRRAPVATPTVDQSQLAKLDVDPQAETKIKRLTPRLAGLSDPVDKPAKHVDLALLGFSAQSVAKAANAAGAKLAANRHPYGHHYVTMAYVSGHHRYTVIDGHFYAQGAMLDGSAVRVRLITTKKILLSGAKGRQWLSVNGAPALAPASAQTVAQSGSPAQPAVQQANFTSQQRQLLNGLQEYSTALKSVQGALKSGM